jgi:hypothetical protein
VEETIDYEALFSAEEWDAICSGDWSEVPSDDWGSSKEGEPSPKYSVFIGNPPGTYEGNEARYEVECDVCDYIGAVDTAEEPRRSQGFTKHSSPPWWRSGR